MKKDYIKMKNKIKLAIGSALLLSSTLYAGDKEDIAMLKEANKSTSRADAECYSCCCISFR
jgi:hypothetical protein